MMGLPSPTLWGLPVSVLLLLSGVIFVLCIILFSWFRDLHDFWQRHRPVGNAIRNWYQERRKRQAELDHRRTIDTLVQRVLCPGPHPAQDATEAVGALAQMGDQTAIDSLGQCLSDLLRYTSAPAYEGLILAIVRTLSTLRPIGLTWGSWSTEPSIRAMQDTIAKELLRIGAPIIDPLINAVKTRALHANDQEYLDEGSVRLLRLLSQFDDPRTVPALVDCLATPDTSLAHEIIDILGEKRDPRAVLALAMLLRSNRSVRRREAQTDYTYSFGLDEHAAWALAQIGEPSRKALEKVLSGTDDTSVCQSTNEHARERDAWRIERARELAARAIKGIDENQGESPQEK
jgi:hypothetical protein